MDFDEYLEKLQLLAFSKRYSIEETQQCLNYATRLHDKNLPIIFDTNHLSLLVGYKKGYIKKAAKYTKYFYRSFDIPKKDHSFRTISEPLPSLKEIQHWILTNILYKIKVHPHSKAYVPGRSIKENIRFHTKKEIVLTLDIHDFFFSINIDTVKECFRIMGYTTLLSDIFSKLCCLNDRLPQGAPTSPYLTNIIMYSFDSAIRDYCRERKINYTRYADDMTFSGSFKTAEVIEYVKKRLSEKGLMLNNSKTKVMTKDMQQIVTGIIVNKYTHISPAEKKKIRQEIFFIKKYGLDNHLSHIQCNKNNYLYNLLGRINYGLYIRPTDDELRQYKEYLKATYFQLN